MRIRTHANPLSFRDTIPDFQLHELFNTSDIDFEIGCGRGVFLRHYAAKYPERSILGVEVRRAAAELLAERLLEDERSNASVFHAPAHRLLAERIPDHSIQRCFIFHPDPWFKKRHHKRRVINPDFLDLLAKKLQANAVLYLSTDVELLFHDMKACLDADKRYEAFDDTAFWQEDYATHWDSFSERDQRESLAVLLSVEVFLIKYR